MICVCVHVFLIIGLTLQNHWCFSHQCQTKNMKVLSKSKIPADDHKPLFTIEGTTFGVLFHRCFYFCGQKQQCIGFEICQGSDGLFRCQACCEWKKLKDYDSLAQSSTCTYYEQDIEFGTNLAFNRTANLSSEYSSKEVASNAVDGIKDCIYANQRVAASLEVRPWLLIHLDRAYYIHQIVIYAKPDYYAYQTDDILVIVNNGNVNQTCGTEYPGPTAPGDVILFMCPFGTRGSFVFIQKTPKTVSAFSLCEVEVYGKTNELEFGQEDQT